MKKKLLIMSTICALAFGMSACGSSEDAATSTEATTSVESTVATETVATEAAETTATETVATEAAETTATETVATEAAETTATETVATDAAETEATDAEVAEGGLTFDIPEGFVESTENYFSCEDTTKASNINTLSMANDGSFDAINSDALMASVEAQLEAATGEDITLTLLEEESYEIDGCRAFKYSIEYEVLGSTFRQLQCIIETADELHFVTFSDVNDEGYFDAFKAAADTLRFE